MKLYRKKDRLLLAGAILLGGITSALAAFISILLQKIVDAATTRNTDAFSQLVFVMLIYLVVLGIFGFAEALLGKTFLKRVTEHLRNDIFCSTLKKSPSDFHTRNSSDYLSAIVNDVKLLEENYFIPLLQSTQMVVMFLTTLGILFYLSPPVTVIMLLCLVLMFLVPALLGKKLQKRQDAYSEELTSFTSYTKDYLNGYDIVCSYNIFTYIYGKFQKDNRRLAKKKYHADKLLAVNEAFSDMLSSLSVLIIIFVAAYLLLIGHISTGTLLALVQLSSTFVMPVVMLMQNVSKMSGIKPIIEKLKRDVAQNIETVDTSISSTDFRQLSCENVTFSYEPTQIVLSGLNLTLNSGGKYALLGGSGCGKTTLIKLLTGYTKDFSGDIRYDGHSVKGMSLSDISKYTALIHQNAFLFDTDIYNNICLGENYTQDELNKVLEISGIRDFLPAMEHGLHTPVGENGQYLSGGQRQRIALARALIRHTPLLIIDEGTSAVDQQTAYDIERRLLTEKHLTVLAITHHMNENLASLYDTIYTMKDGKILKQ